MVCVDSSGLKVMCVGAVDSDCVVCECCWILNSAWMDLRPVRVYVVRLLIGFGVDSILLALRVIDMWLCCELVVGFFDDFLQVVIVKIGCETIGSENWFTL